MRIFYSGISNDKTQFLINMNWYNDNEVETCFSISKNFHGLTEGVCKPLPETHPAGYSYSFSSQWLSSGFPAVEPSWLLQ